MGYTPLLQKVLKTGRIERGTVIRNETLRGTMAREVRIEETGDSLRGSIR